MSDQEEQCDDNVCKYSMSLLGVGRLFRSLLMSLPCGKVHTCFFELYVSCLAEPLRCQYFISFICNGRVRHLVLAPSHSR
eukprot:2250447-Amphidinium_carterae.1